MEEYIGRCPFIIPSESRATVVQIPVADNGFCATPCVLFKRMLIEGEPRTATVYVRHDSHGRVVITDCEAISGKMT